MAKDGGKREHVKKVSAPKSQTIRPTGELLKSPKNILQLYQTELGWNLITCQHLRISQRYLREVQT